MANERKQFHPSVMLVYFIRDLRNWIFLFILLLVDLDSDNLYSYLGLTALVTALIIKSIIKYRTHTYRLSPENIIIYKGIINKKETEIAYDRIQTVKQRQWFFFKPFNVIEILIETAGGSAGEAEASLAAVDSSLLDKIESYRNKTGTGVSQDTLLQAPPASHFTLSNQDILLYALTDLTAILIVGTLAAFVFEWLPERFFFELTSLIDYFEGLLLILLLFIGIGLVVTLSLLKNFILFYNFEAYREEETLTIAYGLFERKTQKIPLGKIQGIRLHKQIIRRRFHRSTVELVIMGGQEKEGEGFNTKKVYLFPLIDDAKVYGQLNQFLPDFAVQEPDIENVSTDRLWYFWRWLLLIGVPLVISAFFINRLIGAASLLILVIALGIEWKKSRVQGYSILDNAILCLQQFQWLSTVQLFIAQKNVQAFTHSTTVWLARKNLGHLTIAYKEGELALAVKLRYIAQSDSKQIHARFWNSM
ncbi:Uncharacterized membrane protein YdbT, contains bPH2 (pleckstrin homology) domain [Alkalibacterium subtropicum]|uniref:Uncharacterized membrane protein YdbT, contains bPH2 (Pleckstrin homology) domain n=1 Tax=Alkalibacterium subtropicum TaxID=753702 RepID=A0A1I1L1Y1_9LACT|nr:PH domain-containing protein [Alkalibacterium subtropicum]SFC66552.1 Uncharacterized membrane protein YdbT, contains bPH2 (pleckstrin homology) domain [Alkalibacterium subtropicum]